MREPDIDTAFFGKTLAGTAPGLLYLHDVIC